MVPYIATNLPPAAVTSFSTASRQLVVWVFGHGLHGLGGVIRGDAVQHCKSSLDLVLRRLARRRHDRWLFRCQLLNQATSPDYHVEEHAMDNPLSAGSWGRGQNSVSAAERKPPRKFACNF